MKLRGQVLYNDILLLLFASLLGSIAFVSINTSTVFCALALAALDTRTPFLFHPLTTTTPWQGVDREAPISSTVH